MVEPERREPKIQFMEKVLSESRLLESVLQELWEENSTVILRAGQEVIGIQQEEDLLGTRRHGGGTMR